MSLSEIKSRILRLREEMKKRGYSHALVTTRSNVFYFSNYRTPLPEDHYVYTVISLDAEPILYVPRLELDSAEEVSKVPVIGYSTYEVERRPGECCIVIKSPLDLIKDYCERTGTKVTKLLVDKLLHKFSTKLKEEGIGFGEEPEVFKELRSIKSEYEVEMVRKAIEITEEAIVSTLSDLSREPRERDIAAKLMHFLIAKGCEELAFVPIVASGPNAANPHYTYGDRVIKPGDVVVLDIGAVYCGYCSDITRTIVIGTSPPKVRQYLDAVLEAQQEAITRIRDGVKACEVDKVAREVLSKHGLSKFFIHGLGHGVGIEVHEAPALSPSSTTTLREGMVVTVEPGVYITKVLGIRVEDVVYVSKSGCRVLTRLSRELYA